MRCLYGIDRWTTETVLYHTSWGNCGEQIATIESMEKNGQLHPLQEAFMEKEAMQCGYCSAGMIMSGVALLEKNQNPSENEIVQFMNGNICRCGTYPRIVDAIRQAARVLRGGAK